MLMGHRGDHLFPGVLYTGVCSISVVVGDVWVAAIARKMIAVYEW